MSKPRPPPDQRRRHLSKEDEALWENTAETLKPLKRAKQRVHPLPEIAAADTRPAAQHRHHAPAAEAIAAAREQHRTAQKARDALLAKAPPLSDFDRKAARRLRGGNIEIEARVDLHGMRQGEAHSALTRFLTSCYARRMRWVLVITGKGGKRQRGDEDEDTRGFGGSGEPGVLKRNVPQWLAEPELRAIVVSFTTAAIQHGGEGAMYIQLRNPDRPRARD